MIHSKPCYSDDRSQCHVKFILPRMQWRQK